MRKLGIPIGSYTEGSIHSKTLYEFYEVFPEIFEGTELAGSIFTIAWAKWDTKSKGWMQRLPLTFEVWIPDTAKHPEASAAYDFALARGGFPQEYNQNFTLYEDGSGVLVINDNVSLNFGANTFNTDIPFSEAHTLLFNSYHGKGLEMFQCVECGIEFTKSDKPHGFTPAKNEIGVLACFCGKCFVEYIECEKCGLATKIVYQDECTHCGHNNRDSIPLYIWEPRA